MTKKAGSGSGSTSQRHGSADPDPDPHQNVMDPQHCLQLSTCLGMVEESDDTVLVLVRADPAAAVVPVLHHVREGARGLQLRARALDINRADDAAPSATDSAATGGGRRKHPGRFGRKALGFG
jgi:hypothetical protein